MTVAAPKETHEALEALAALAGVELALEDGPFADKVRAGALLDRAEADSPATQLGDARIDWARSTLTLGGQAQGLTEAELALLRALVDGGGQGASSDALMERVLGYRTDLETHTLATHIYRLRGKLGARAIETMEDGYRLAALADADEAGAP